MGVPGLFSWLRRRFPKIVRRLSSSKTSRKPETACDHLYIDMNHVLHSCAHSLGMERDDGPLEGIFGNIEKYIDYIVETAEPQRLVMLSIDGVAPKAKLTQQRTRRFLGVYRKQIAQEESHQLKEHMGRNSVQLTRALASFDQNVITPGTPFMSELNKLLQRYVEKRLRHGKKWSRLKILLSTANEPGEGEHKIMTFIKDQRRRRDTESETRHVVFGQDADLIVQSLMTHESHFRIFREDLPPIGTPPQGKLPKLETIDIGILRKRLKSFLKPQRKPNVIPATDDESPTHEGQELEETEIEFVFERAVEDFVVLSFLIGNDFIPAIPSLDVYDHEGGMERIVGCYRKTLRRILRCLIHDETAAYKRIKENLRNFNALLAEKFGNELKRLYPQRIKNQQGSDRVCPEWGESNKAAADRESEPKGENRNERLTEMDADKLTRLFKSALMKRIDATMLSRSEIDEAMLGEPGYENRYYVDRRIARHKRVVEYMSRRVGREYLRALNWSFAYYSVGVNPVATTEESRLFDVGGESANDGCDTKYAAWDWSYSYHYAPLIKDLMRACWKVPLHDVLNPGVILEPATKWNLNRGPVRPLVQLLAVLPPESAEACLPIQLARLLKATRLDSRDTMHILYCVRSIRNMFPQSIGRIIDARGKRWAHTVIVRLPPVDYSILCRSARAVSRSSHLTEEEEVGQIASFNSAALFRVSPQERNCFSCGELYVRREQYEELEKSVNSEDVPIRHLIVPPLNDRHRQRPFKENQVIKLGLDIAGVVIHDRNTPAEQISEDTTMAVEDFAQV